MQLLQILWDRREFFLICLLEHIRISLTAVVCAGVLGILLGALISRHEKLAGVVLGVINVIYTIPSISLPAFRTFADCAKYLYGTYQCGRQHS